jgi:hypothetical protein
MLSANSSLGFTVSRLIKEKRTLPEFFALPKLRNTWLVKERWRKKTAMLV